MMAPVCSGSAADEAVFWRERAGCLAAENVRLAGTVAVQREQIAALKQRVVTLSRMLFGTSSEKGDPGRPEAGGGDGDGPGGGGDGRGDGGGAGEGRRGQRPGSAGHGRRRHDHLEAEEQVHDVPEGERRCPRCGRAYELFGEDASEQVSWRVRVWRIVHRRRKYARSCRCPVPAVVTAPGPAKLTGRGLFTTEFCVNLLVAKYALGLPFNRVIAMLSFQGLEVAPGTLAGVARRLDILLAPLAGAIAARNAASGHAHVDETSWRVFGQPADCGGDRWWLWVFTGPDTVVYQIAPSRSLKVLEGHYGVTGGQLPEGRGPLVISSDFYSVYRSFSELDGVTPLWCFAHIRRRFIRAGDAHRKELGAWADAWTARIGTLYAAHRQLAAAPEGTGGHARAAAAFEAALEDIDAHRRIQGRRPDLLHPAAAKVLATLDREWDGLARHREFPGLPLDNNTAERAIRTPVAGRKNYSGSGARWAADLAGRAWTILGTARIAGHNPRAYLSIYPEACAANGGKPPTGQPCCHGTSPCPASPPRQGTRPAGHRDRRRHPAPRRPGPLLRPGLHPRRAGGHRPARGDAAQPRRDLPRRLRRPRLARLRRAAQGHDRPRRPEQDGRRHPDHPAASRQWNQLIRDHHYLGYTPLAGAQIRYLAAAPAAGQIAALAFAASAWKCAPRDTWIGWDPATRSANLNLICGNARFLIRPDVAVPNLASWLLAAVTRRLPADWQARYGYAPVLAETFVETPRFTAASYRAANWTRVGRTQGRGKLDRRHEHALPDKDIYLYPLHRRWRQILTTPPSQ